MITQDSVAEAVRAAGLPVPGRFIPVTGSTNLDVFAMAEHGAPEWTVVVAGRQEAGRGRHGRTWVSTEGGESLLASLLLRPSIPPPDAPLVSLLAGLCMAEACRDACGVEVRCKWPNDLVAGGRKLGGILIEATVRPEGVDHVVVGTGVNVGQAAEDFPEVLRTTATSLTLEGGTGDASALLAAYLTAMLARYQPDGTGLKGQVLAAYRDLCDTIGRTVRATTALGEQVEGTATGIGDGGDLRVETPAGEESIGFGEIVHLD
jgi:BirA family biotin operon repressor/biotin-[acetyl-CoA-carboxylase] ligase